MFLVKVQPSLAYIDIELPLEHFISNFLRTISLTLYPVIKSYLLLIIITFLGRGRPGTFSGKSFFAPILMEPSHFHSLDNNSRTSMISRLGIPLPPSLESILGPSFDTVFCATPIPLFGSLASLQSDPSQDFFELSALALKDARLLYLERDGMSVLRLR